jgi:hypothetical protein
MRVESDRPCLSAKTGGGWFHKIDETVADKKQLRPKLNIKPRLPVRDFSALSIEYQENLRRITDSSRDRGHIGGIDFAAEDLGVSVESLERLGIGWNGKAFTFPMYNGYRKAVGIRIRSSIGKWCVNGSQNGLFWPSGIPVRAEGYLLLPEGPTSCAACLTLGFDSIGRPNCMLGAQELLVALKKIWRRHVVIIADHDEPHKRPNGDIYYPGQDGAAQIASVIKPVCRTLRIIYSPFTNKDPRDWLRSGITKGAVECIIRDRAFE